ncbi:MAG: hypothetical protein ACK559_15175, partial [bacterium]
MCSLSAANSNSAAKSWGASLPRDERAHRGNRDSAHIRHDEICVALPLRSVAFRGNRDTLHACSLGRGDACV